MSLRAALLAVFGRQPMRRAAPSLREALAESLQERPSLVTGYRGEGDRSAWSDAANKPTWGRFYSGSPDVANTHAMSYGPDGLYVEGAPPRGGRIYRDIIDTSGFETWDLMDDAPTGDELLRRTADARSRGVPGFILENVQDIATPAAGGSGLAHRERQFLVLDESRINPSDAAPSLRGVLAGRAVRNAAHAPDAGDAGARIARPGEIERAGGAYTSDDVRLPHEFAEDPGAAAAYETPDAMNVNAGPRRPLLVSDAPDGSSAGAGNAPPYERRIGPNGDRLFLWGPGDENLLRIRGDGSVILDRGLSTYTKGSEGTTAEAWETFRPAYRALVDDAATTARPVYVIHPATDRLAQFYRGVFARRPLPGYRFEEAVTEGGGAEMRLVRAPDAPNARPDGDGRLGAALGALPLGGLTLREALAERYGA